MNYIVEGFKDEIVKMAGYFGKKQLAGVARKASSSMDDWHNLKKINESKTSILEAELETAKRLLDEGIRDDRGRQLWKKLGLNSTYARAGKTSGSERWGIKDHIVDLERQISRLWDDLYKRK